MAAALSNYQLGDLLGRGASGSVFRALNFLTGETVAIKSISLQSLGPSLLPDIMSEIDLLKNLNHPNIVKYKGFARDRDSLFIVLEYCENGSLQSIVKKFGKFPESLVAVYVSQVLEGLVYLHEQGVIHRDIKGANILTNKDGSVKLADFGVSSRAAAPVSLGGAKGGDNDNEVVGSPYWMAPEVIEQSGATTASDIWSVGCVVVELLEGKPPYGDLAPMQALWRIVQDESMRIPEGASPIVKDFLYHCFQKDPNLRVSAKKLLRHPWMQSARKTLDSAATHAASRPKADTSTRSRPGTIRALPPASEGAEEAYKDAGATVKGKKPMTVYDEAVQRVQEWNEALNASPKATGTLRKLPAIQTSARNACVSRQLPPGSAGPSSGLFALAPLPTRSSGDSVSSSTSAPLNGHVGQVGLLQKNLHVSDVLSRARESVEAEVWDDDFASDITLSKIAHKKVDSTVSEEPDQMTLRPYKRPALGVKSLPELVPPLPRKGSVSDDDYSDLAVGEDNLEFKLASMRLKDKGRKRLMHPDDLRKIGTLSPAPKTISASASASAPAPVRSMSTPLRPAAAPLMSPSLSVPASPRPTRSPPGSRQNSMRGRRDTPDSVLELQKYSEKDEDDFSDMFDVGTQPVLGGSRDTLQLTRRSNRSWQEDEEDDDADPFAEINDDFDAEDLEANILRDKRATLCASVNRVVDQMQVDTPQATLRTVCDELLSMFENAPDMGLESHFVASHGMLAILDVLESRLSRDVAVRLLKIVNYVVSLDVENLESFCLVGGIPVIIPYTTKRHSMETRLEASAFVQLLTRSALTLQMFISCRGLKILVELLDEDYTVNKTLILSAFEGIGSVFDLQSPTPKPDFCRMFVREGILDPLSTAFLAVLKDPEVSAEDAPKRAVEVLLLFCQVAQADTRVREAFATRTIMMRLLKALDVLPRRLLVTAIKAVKHLSTSPQLIEVLQNSNAMEVLVGLLGKSLKGAHSNEICSHLFQAIYSMCRLSKARQEEAASSGIIPLLRRVIQTKSPLKQFALPILCDLANAGKVSRRLLWQNEWMSLYLGLLDDPYWRISALEAVLAWMQDETARVEDLLLDKDASDSLVKCFVQSSGVSFEGILDPFLKILRLSPALTAAISSTAFFRRLSDTLERPSRAVTKLSLLRITRVACEAHPDRATLVSRFSLASIVDRLARQDDAILVRELAKEIYPSLLFGDPAVGARDRTDREQQPQQTKGQALALRNTLERRPSSAMRRSTSESTVPMTVRAATPPSPAPVRTRTPVPTASAVAQAQAQAIAEEKRHRRKISRTQLRDVQWETDENGRLESVRGQAHAKPG
ncbi:Protein kinase of the Mitotic Exit Network [Cryptotrichosporon argae]